GPELSFSPGRGLWQTTDVRATVREARGVDGVELSVNLEARHSETGERLIFLAIVPQLEGEHTVQIFGRLGGFDRDQGYVRLLPFSSACSASAESATLIIDTVDTAARTMDGRFLAHVCGVESDHTWTLGEGRFVKIPY
ncbi:MAG: hypothetical protein AAGF23_17060, partial [Acidobacteriota bacterium]